MPRWRTWRAGSPSCVSVASVLKQTNRFRRSVWLQTTHLPFLQFLHRWRPVQVLRAKVPYRVLLLNATRASFVHPPVLSALHTETEGHQGSQQVLCTDSVLKTNCLLPKSFRELVHCEVRTCAKGCVKGTSQLQKRCLWDQETTSLCLIASLWSY